jgi:hypothetical protein
MTRRLFGSFFMITALLPVPGLYAQATAHWIQLTPVGGPPPTREMNSAVYDSTSNRLIVFGGCVGGMFCECSAAPVQVFNDVWVLTNANGLGGTPAWLELTPTGGPPQHVFCTARPTILRQTK